MKTARVGDAGAVVRDENSRRSPSRSEPLLGFVDGGQSCFEDRRILFLGEVRPLGHDEAAGADVGVRDGAGGDQRQRLVGLDDLSDLRANLRFVKAQQDMDAKARRGRERTMLGLVQKIAENVLGALALDRIGGDEHGHAAEAVRPHYRSRRKCPACGTDLRRMRYLGANSIGPGKCM
jgi:hypothetical protein